jgi:hypothetical protein
MSEPKPKPRIVLELCRQNWWEATLYVKGKKVSRVGSGRTAYAAFANLVEYMLEDATEALK